MYHQARFKPRDQFATGAVAPWKGEAGSRDQVHNHINMFFPKTNVIKSLSSLTMTVFVVISGFGMCEFRFWHFLLHDPISEFVGNHGSCFDKFEHPGFSLGPTPKCPIVVALPRDVTVCPPVLIQADDPKNPNWGTR